MAAFEGFTKNRPTLTPGGEPARRAAERALWTCAVESGAGSSGTGILINHDLVMTNYHVIENLLANPARRINACCRFDFKTDEYTGEILPGRRVGFAEKWDVVNRPYSDKDRTGARTGFGLDELDFAIIRLAESVGSQPVDTEAGTIPARRWQTLPGDPIMPSIGMEIDIWQHPADWRSTTIPRQIMPQLHAVGKVLEVLDIDLRMRHGTDTSGGSSGGGCFDSDFNLVALHHATDPDAVPGQPVKWNQAIPLTAIVRHLKANGHGHLLDVAPPPPAPPRRAETVARGAQLTDIVEKRVRTVQKLMDRNNVEEDVIWSRRKENKNRGIVHVLACRNIDSHRNFLDRLRKLTLVPGMEVRDKRLQRISNFLNAKYTTASGDEWQHENLIWPVDEANSRWKLTADDAFEFIKLKLEEFARSRRPLLVEACVAIDKVKLGRERKLVPMVARHCAEIASADRLQLFVTYHDPVATKAKDQRADDLRADLGSLWPKHDRPPGGGICANLNNVSYTDLDSWCRVLESSWKLQDDDLSHRIESVLGGESVPMRDAEQRAEPILRDYVPRR